MLKANCTVDNQKFVLPLHYNSDDSYLFVNGVQQYKFNTKDSEIKTNKLIWGNITDQFSSINTIKSGLGGDICYFSADYQPTTVNKIQKIHSYLMKKITSYKMISNQYFPPYAEPHSENIRVELDLTNYATKTDLNSITHVDTSSFALKTNLPVLKTEVNKLDIDKLTSVSSDLSKLSKEVQEDFTTKTDFNNLKTKVDVIHLCQYVLNSKYDSEIGDLKLKIPNISGLLQASVFNSKITEIEEKITTAKGKIPDISNSATKTEVATKVTTVENKIPNISGLATKTQLTAVQNKIPHVNGFVKKTDYATEIRGIENNYFTNAALSSQLKDLKSTHISDEIKKIDDKVKKNASDILGYESRLKKRKFG